MLPTLLPRRTRLSLIGLIILSAVAWIRPGEGAAVGLDDPVATVNQFRDALQDGNVARVLALLAPDVLIYEEGNQEASRDEYAAHHLEADIASLKKVSTDTLGQAGHVDGDTAWVTTRSRLVAREANSRQPVMITETIVLRRVAGNWQIAHVHWSSASAGDAP